MRVPLAAGSALAFAGLLKRASVCAEKEVTAIQMLRHACAVHCSKQANKPTTRDGSAWGPGLPGRSRAGGAAPATVYLRLKQDE